MPKILTCQNCNYSSRVFYNAHTFTYQCPICGSPFDILTNAHFFRKIRKLRGLLFTKLSCDIALLRAKRRTLKIGKKVHIYPSFKCVSGNLIVGNHVFLNDAFIDATSLVTIGDFTSFGPGVKILTATHDITKFGIERQRNFISKPISIGNGVFIAAGVIVIGGTRIGDNAVIGAGSVVSKDIPESTLAAGSPAHVLRRIG